MAFQLRDYETIRLASPAPHVLLATLDRPEVANAINTQMGQDLHAVFDGLAADPLAFRCAVLTGSGSRAFCAGGDLKQRNGMTDEEWRAQRFVFERLTRALVMCPVPIIAAINGVAFGGGVEVMLGCDFAYAVPHARFALTEVTLGIMPGAGATLTLPHAVGPRRAKEIILTGAPFSAEEALAWGVVNKICPAETLLDDTLATATRIAANAPIATRQAKHSINMGLGTDLYTGMMFEFEAYNRLVSTEDRREGIAAFNEKRNPVYKGR